jgi:hypothetical protein
MDERLPFVVFIKNNETGEIREHHDELIIDEETKEPSLFIWEEGNYSCDCNRELFFLRAKHESEESVLNQNRCTDGRFSVKIKEAQTGRILYSEY